MFATKEKKGTHGSTESTVAVKPSSFPSFLGHLSAPLAQTKKVAGVALDEMAQHVENTLMQGSSVGMDSELYPSQLEVIIYSNWRLLWHGEILPWRAPNANSTLDHFSLRPFSASWTRIAMAHSRSLS